MKKKNRKTDRPDDDINKHPLGGEYMFDGYYMMPDGNIVTEDEMYGYQSQKEDADKADDEDEEQQE